MQLILNNESRRQETAFSEEDAPTFKPSELSELVNRAD
jgi:hypothetical protein